MLFRSADVYHGFDQGLGEVGFDERRVRLTEALASAHTAADLVRLPPNDLAFSPYSGILRDQGAFRAGVSGAGPCVYGLFATEDDAMRAEGAVRPAGQTWLVRPC